MENEGHDERDTIQERERECVAEERESPEKPPRCCCCCSSLRFSFRPRVYFFAGAHCNWEGEEGSATTLHRW
ncbi:hypothetical protein TIFTF001_056165 [Ficus carica]|uniref:Uncharacterized protein n=1 Tax=Ficus carica TaxID=3494 RepID=A0AA88EFM7_FICCA|nr:hypothetical protein TIFTF001_056165 [Ficus carica]